MTTVLVHGGGCTKECWDLMIPHLEGDVLAVDLPGRGGRPGVLTTIGIADFVDAVVDDLESRDLHDVVLVGHSLAGLTIPQVAGRVAKRIRALVFVSCTVPRDGQSVYDTLDADIQAISDSSPKDALATLDAETQQAVFYNDVDDPDLLEWAVRLVVPEAPATLSDPMVLSTMPPDLRRVWVRLARDAIVAPEKQDRFIENLGGAEVLELDAAHMAMISRPRELAEILGRI
jgi:pimeloyl-ACP methyl ester carboxylesterase